MHHQLATFFLLTVLPAVLCTQYTLYDNDFLDPGYFLAKSFANDTGAAQQSIVEWADYLASQGPWSVMNKSLVPPSGNKHDYMSWAPYFWPNCTGVGNTTQLTPQQIWTTCPYFEHDGMINPDRTLVTDQAYFSNLADAVFYNAIAWVLTGTSKYSANVAYFVNMWFIDPNTSMNPNLNYAQMDRGPDGQNGTHTGILDLKTMSKLTTGLLILRNGNSSDWTADMNNQMVAWTNEYIKWLQTSPIALGEYNASNNHGTYYYNQLASLQVLVGDSSGALSTIKTYFSRQYLAQINANGDQPLESVRTHPYHYRTYNLEAMIVNARIGKYLGTDFWNTKTSQGATIQTALDFAMSQNITASGDGPPEELHPAVAAVAVAYGDPNGKYAKFLAAGDNQYPAEPYFLWNQPLSDSGLAAATPTVTGQPKSTSKGSSSQLNSRDSVVWHMMHLVIIPVVWKLYGP